MVVGCLRITEWWLDVKWWLKHCGFNGVSYAVCMCRHSIQLSGMCEAKVNYQEDVLSFLPSCSLVICVKVPKLLNKSLGKFQLMSFLLDPVI